MENEEKKPTETENPWSNRRALQKPEGRYTLLCCATLAVSSLTFPLALNLWAALVCWTLLALGALALGKKARTPTFVTVGATAALTMLFPEIGALMLALILGIACGGYLLTVYRTVPLYLLIPAAASGIGYLVTRDLLTALLPLILLVPAILFLAVSTMMGEYRTTVICWGAGGLLLSVLLLVGIAAYGSCGSLSPGALREWVQSGKDYVTEIWFSERDAALEMAKDRAEDLKRILSDEILRDTVEETFNILPGIAVIVCLVGAFGAQKTLNGMYLTSGMDEVLTPESEFFTMSVPSAVVFALSFVVTCFASPLGDVGAVAMNLALILLPGMILIGVRSIRSKFRPTGGRGINPWLVGLILVGCCSGQLLWLLGLIGSYGRVELAVRARMNRENGNPGGGSPYDGE